uniref:Uncharacterized protein n=1 Tax=Arundo donax TaxID=35708 RepID=A0A0A9BNF2_ARUDO
MNTAITGVQTSLADITRAVTGVMDRLTRLEKVTSCRLRVIPLARPSIQTRRRR